MFRRLLKLLPFLLALGALVALGMKRATRERRPALVGIEDPEAVRAYDRVSRMTGANRFVVSPNMRRLRLAFARHIAGYDPEGTVVDVGCGPGYLLAAIAEEVPGLELVGVDVSKQMIEQARANLEELGFGKRVSFRVGSVERLPFEDGSTDFLVSTLSLHHWADPSAALREMHRVLKSRGQLLIVDVRRDVPRGLLWILRCVQQVVMPAGLRAVGEPSGSFAAAYTPDEVEAMLSELPFELRLIEPSLLWTYAWARKA